MPIPLRADFDAQMVRGCRETIRRMARKHGGFWLWRRFTKAQLAPRRRRLAV